MKDLAKYSFITLLVFTLSGCLQYKEVKVVDVGKIGVKEISMKGIKVEVEMQIKNPNKYDISIVDSDLDLYLKGNKMGEAKIQEKVTLPKKSNKIHRFTIQTNVKDLLSGALPVLLSLLTENSIELQVKGDIKAKAKGIGKKFPVDFKEKVKL